MKKILLALLLFAFHFCDAQRDIKQKLFFILNSSTQSQAPLIASDAKPNQTTPFNVYILLPSENSGFTNSDVSAVGATVGTLTSNDNLFWTGVVTPDSKSESITLSVGSETLIITSAESELVDYINEIPNVSGTEPDLADRIRTNSLIKYYKDEGVWNLHDRIWKLNTTGNENTALINLKSPGTDNLTISGTLTFSDGFTSNGTTGYLNTNFTPSTDGVNYTLNDASIIFYTRSVTNNSAVFDLGTNVGALTAINAARLSNGTRFAINQASNFDLTNTLDIGTHHFMRTASNRIAFYRNGSIVGTGTTASSALSTGPFYLAALNNAGTASSFTTRPYEWLSVGSNLEAKATEINIGIQNALITDVDINANLNYVNSSIDVAVEDIYMRCFYKSKANQPLLILMAGYAQSATDFTDATYDRFRDLGFFVAGIGIRGNNGATGTRDDSARELQDIVDAIDYLKVRFSGLIDTDKISIVGYSGGGGNVIGLISKYPDLFATAVAFFPITDYGYDATYGWYNQEPSRQSTLEARIGGNPSTLSNSYKSRQHTASASNFTGKLYLFHDEDDTQVEFNHSQILVDSLIDNGFTNYVADFTNSSDGTRWTHDLPNSPASVINAESIFDDDCLTLEAQPIPTSGTVVINGFIKTKLFELWIEDGTLGRAYLTYNVVSNSYTVTPYIDSPLTEFDISFTDVFGRTFTATISGPTTFSAE